MPPRDAMPTRWTPNRTVQGWAGYRVDVYRRLWQPTWAVAERLGAVRFDGDSVWVAAEFEAIRRVCRREADA
jgi:hypothetical protein